MIAQGKKSPSVETDEQYAEAKRRHAAWQKRTEDYARQQSDAVESSFGPKALRPPVGKKEE